MSPSMLALLGSAYVLANAVCVAAYLPQIWQVWVSPSARLQVVLLTWWAWTLGGLTEWAYAALVAHQDVWVLVAVGHAGACGTVALLGTQARVRAWRHRRTLNAQRHPEVALLEVR